MRIIQIVLIILISCVAAVAQEPPPAKVVVAKVVQQKVAENKSFIGLLTFDKVSGVSSEVAGLVEMIQMKEGDRVKQGDPLVRLNTDILEKEIASAKNRIEQLSLRIENSSKDYKRLQDLFSQKAVSEREYDNSFYSYQDLIKEKQAAIVTLEKVEIQLKKSIINAPFDGIVLAKNIEKGEWVQQGKELIRLGSANDIIVRVPVSENLLAFAGKGETVTLEVNAISSRMNGTIVGIDPVADVQTKNVFVKVKVVDPKVFVENLSVTVFLPISEKKQLNLIPRDALVKFQGQDFVYTVKDNKAAILPINIVTYLSDKVGADNPYFVSGMPIVIEGNERLRPDQPVAISGEK